MTRSLALLSTLALLALAACDEMPIPTEPDGGIGDGAGLPMPTEPDGGIGDGAGPGDVVTEEFVAERLNFRIDAAGLVAAVDCG